VLAASVNILVVEAAETSETSLEPLPEYTKPTSLKTTFFINAIEQFMFSY
jgi:hypothetical protein